MKKVVVLGAGISGLASAALLAAKGHDVTVIEKNTWLGGKSRRIELLGQRMDTGPALVTYPEVWQQFLATYDGMSVKKSQDLIDLEFERLNEVGRYFFKNHVTDLPVNPKHHWHKPWKRFVKIHSQLTPAISSLLTSPPMSIQALPALFKMSKVYGKNLTTEKYVGSLDWMPKGLKEVIAIHTLNAGIAPDKTMALYASMTASMAEQGISVPIGGVNEIPLAIAKLAEAAGAKILLGQEVTKLSKNKVTTPTQNFEADLIVSSLDEEVHQRLLRGKLPDLEQPRSCSGVAIYAVLKKPLPEQTVTHSVIMPDDPQKLYDSLENRTPPAQTMAFVNYYKAGQIYPNQKPTVAVLLTAPSDGKAYDLGDGWVAAELTRISKKLGLKQNIQTLFEAHEILTAEYFEQFGAAGGALYGRTRKLWQSGPFHSPSHSKIFKPWLIRVGASTHPGGGIPAVLGGVLIALRKVLA